MRGDSGTASPSCHARAGRVKGDWASLGFAFWSRIRDSTPASSSPPSLRSPNSTFLRSFFCDKASESEPEPESDPDPVTPHIIYPLSRPAPGHVILEFQMICSISNFRSVSVSVPLGWEHHSRAGAGHGGGHAMMLRHSGTHSGSVGWLVKAGQNKAVAGCWQRVSFHLPTYLPTHLPTKPVQSINQSINH
jgi:hypothetical protein